MLLLIQFLLSKWLYYVFVESLLLLPNSCVFNLSFLFCQDRVFRTSFSHHGQTSATGFDQVLAAGRIICLLVWIGLLHQSQAAFCYLQHPIGSHASLSHMQQPCRRSISLRIVLRTLITPIKLCWLHAQRMIKPLSLIFGREPTIFGLPSKFHLFNGHQLWNIAVHHAYIRLENIGWSLLRIGLN